MEKSVVADPLSSGEPDSDGTAAGVKTWVKFNDDGSPASEHVHAATATTATVHSPPAEDSDQNGPPAVIETSVAIVPTVQIQSPSKVSVTSARGSGGSNSNSGSGSNATSPAKTANNTSSTSKDNSTFINVELRNSQPSSSAAGEGSNGIRRAGFTNGDEIVSIVPMNTRWPWVTPAVFRPELVPEELMNESLTLTVEEYVHIMEMLTTDFRFNVYIICYKRLLAAWLATAFFILLIILFSSVGGVTLFALGITWLIINAAAVFLCMYIKIKINKGLERCMARVNKLLLKHKLIVGVDDRGRLSCHKIQLTFIYYDATECIKRLAHVVEAATDPSSLQRHLDSTAVDIVVGSGTNSRRIPQSQCEALFLRYLQTWFKDYARKLATLLPPASSPVHPSHVGGQQNCACQYATRLLKEKRDADGFKNCFTICGTQGPLESQVTATRMQLGV